MRYNLYFIIFLNSTTNLSVKDLILIKKYIFSTDLYVELSVT